MEDHRLGNYTKKNVTVSKSWRLEVWSQGVGGKGRQVCSEAGGEGPGLPRSPGLVSYSLHLLVVVSQICVCLHFFIRTSVI